MGLDFGTTNSALALSELGSTRVVRINNMISDESTLRSVLFMNHKHDNIVGQRAVEEYIKSEGRSCRFLQSLKTFLSDASFTGTTIFGQRFEIDDLVSIILKEIKYLGEQHLGHNIDQVVMGRPVMFSDEQVCDQLAEKRLRTAASKAGFKNISFEYEPIAATLAYLKQMDAAKEEIVLMGDFGGGTSDFTVMRLNSEMPKTQKEKRQRILSMNGVYIGGDTFDSKIMWEKIARHFGKDITLSYDGDLHQSVPRWIVHTLCEWHAIPFLNERKTLETIRVMKRVADAPKFLENLEHLIRENKGFAVFRAIEKAKAELSKNVSSVISYHDKCIHIEETISRAEFDSFIEKDLAGISACVAKTLSDAAIARERIDKVLLTGGSSFVPAVRKIFCEMFDEDKIINLDAFTSVAHGLAMSASFR
jgi:hypothetical chaperone protein